MKHTTASCGHSTPAIGAEGSIARKKCESEPCLRCRLSARWHEIQERINDCDDFEFQALIAEQVAIENVLS